MSTTAERARHMAIRVPLDDLSQIDALAAEHKLNRTQYVIRASLGTLDHVGTDKRLDELEQRLTRLEHATFG